MRSAQPQPSAIGDRITQPTFAPMLRSISASLSLATLLLSGLVPPAASAQHACRASKQGLGANLLKDGPLAQWPVDLLHQHLELDLTQGNIIAGATTLTLVPRGEATTTVPLHLAALNVDSVTSPDGALTYSHVGHDLSITLPAAASPADTVELTVHYHGDPVTDPSGFGGFYTSPALTYNLGVAFQTIPHSFGRAWFPCVDNFTERSSYSFSIKTHGGRGSWCNGERTGITLLGGDTIVTHWHIDEPIPSYLVSVAAANYREVHDSYTSISGQQIPVKLVAAAADTAAMKSSFLHLPDAFDAFEHWFGAYNWNKVGYVLTTEGAMEHSTSIHYPRSIANGTLSYENIMAHELAHQWFGDLVTCERAEEMYLNEGFAEYLSYLFLEAVYGRPRYLADMRTNHRQMLQQAHLLDQGWWALADVPQQWTYGEHSYNKGADVIHTLRGYLDDSLFRSGMTSFLQANAFKPVNSAMLRDHLTQFTGKDMTDFFNDWIFQPGWAAFEVDSFRVSPPPTPGAAHPVTIHITQKQRGPSQPYNNVPLTVTCLDAAGNVWSTTEPVHVSGPQSSVSVLSPLVPKWIVLNTDERISQAVTFDMDTLTVPGTVSYYHTDLRLTVVQTPQPFTVYTEEYWVAADEATDAPFAYVVSPDRYWRITGAFPEGAQVNARFSYDGRPNISSPLDPGLMQDFEGVSFTEDSLVLLHRPDASWPWSRFPQQTLSVLGNPDDRIGRIDITNMKAGEYVLAWRKSAVGIGEHADHMSPWTIAPNPATDLLQVTSTDADRRGVLELIDSSGRTVRSTPVQGRAAVMQVSDLASGTYQLRFIDARQGRQPIGPVMVK